MKKKKKQENAKRVVAWVIVSLLILGLVVPSLVGLFL